MIIVLQEERCVCESCHVFKLSNVLGNSPSHLMFEKIKIKEENEIPRCFDDYKIEVDEKMPEGVELIEKL